MNMKNGKKNKILEMIKTVICIMKRCALLL